MTGYGFGGPMTATGTLFDAKEESVGGGGADAFLLLHVGSILLFLMVRMLRDVR